MAKNNQWQTPYPSQGIKYEVKELIKPSVDVNMHKDCPFLLSLRWVTLCPSLTLHLVLFCLAPQSVSLSLRKYSF